eukprot:gene15072-16627_t
MDEQKEDENESLSMWNKVEVHLSIEVGKRKKRSLEQLLPWFVARSAVFGGLQKASLIGMIQNSFLLRCRPDYVLFNQGDIGNCFYVIVRGAVSVYARPSDVKTHHNLKRLSYAKGQQERARFGNELAQLGSGRCFGELSVLSEDGERNATIITDEPTVLICFERNIFLKFVDEKFANELLRKSGFVQTNSLFKKWPLAYKNLLTECLQIRNVEFGEKIVEQGTEVNSVYFIVEGQAKVSMNIGKHPEQYKGAISKQFERKLSEFYTKNERRAHDDGYDDEDDECAVRFPVLERRRRRREEGFFATEMRKRPDIDLCLVIGANGLIGDIEAIHEIPTYAATYRCIQATTLYELDIPSFHRLIIKKNPDTFETIKRIANAKLQYRSTSIKGGIPLYSVLMDKPGVLGSEDRILPKIRALQAKKEKKMSRNLTILPDRKKDRSIRSQKMKVSINPATGEVIVKSSSNDDEKRKVSLLNRETTRASGKQDEEAAATSGGAKGEQATAGKRLAKMRNVGKAVVRIRIGAKKNEDTEESNGSVNQYKVLKQKMQAMTKMAHRTSWNG